MSSPESNWHAWVRKAEHDRLNIRNNLVAQEVPWDTVCFHAQQVAEKMLKAFLVVHGVQPPKIHDLMALLGECLAHDALLDELRSPCLLLNAYPVVIRYPEPFPEPGEAEGRMAAEAAERVFPAILRRLPAPRAEAGAENGE